MNLTPGTDGERPPELLEDDRRRARRGRPRRRVAGEGPGKGRQGPRRFHRRRRPGARAADALDHDYADVRAIADIRPDSLAAADEILKKKRQPPAKHYVEFADMLEHEDIEAIITAPPLWMHADIVTACLNAGKHVLCEKMMAKTRRRLQRDDRSRDAEPPRARDRLPAQLQPGLPHGLRRRDEDRRAGRDSSHAPRLGAATATGGATRPRRRRTSTRPVGLPDVGSSRELAAVLALLAKACSPSSAATR